MNKLKMSKDIYSIEQIKEAAFQFNSIAQISITSDSNYYVCSFANCKYDITETVKEFENYAIDLYIHLGKNNDIN